MLVLIAVIIGILVFLYIGIHFYYAYKTLNPVRLKNTHPRMFGMDYEEFCIRSGRSFIKGWLIHNKEAKNGTIIMAHNLGANRTKILPYARFLHEAGYHVVLFDFRGHGESGNLKGFLGYLDRLEEDLRSVVDYVKNSDWFYDTNKNIGIYGFSMGTIPSMCISGAVPEVKAVVLECGPFISVGQVFKRTFGRFVKPNKWMLSSIYVAAIKVLLSKNSQFIKKAAAEIYPKAVFFIHGEKDFLISPEETRHLFDIYCKEPKFYWSVANSYHLTNFKLYPEEYKERVLSFFNNFLAIKSEVY